MWKHWASRMPTLVTWAKGGAVLLVRLFGRPPSRRLGPRLMEIVMRDEQTVGTRLAEKERERISTPIYTSISPQKKGTEEKKIGRGHRISTSMYTRTHTHVYYMYIYMCTYVDIYIYWQCIYIIYFCSLIINVAIFSMAVLRHEVEPCNRPSFHPSQFSILKRLSVAARVSMVNSHGSTGIAQFHDRRLSERNGGLSNGSCLHSWVVSGRW